MSEKLNCDNVKTPEKLSPELAEKISGGASGNTKIKACPKCGKDAIGALVYGSWYFQCECLNFWTEKA